MAKLLIFNWKMNPETLEEALFLAMASDYKNVVVAPPFPFLEEVGKVFKKAKLGAQDLFWEEKGAFTGEVSVKELKSVGAKYVIIGHSERRHKLGETDEMAAKKVKAALDEGLIPVLCVGETKKEKDAGQRETVIKRQLEKGLSLVSQKSNVKGQMLLIAYEPVWAIGTGDPETPGSAAETIRFIKKILESLVVSHKSLVLYGGSVNSQNLGDYLKYKEVAGALIGGASLKKEEMRAMVKLIGS